MIRFTPTRFQPAVAFILVTALLDVMALGLVIPVLPALVEEFAHSDGAAGLWNGLLVALWAAMQFLFSPLIGALSDRYGRRPVILISTIGLALDWLLMALAPNLWWLAVGRMLGGITSSSFTAVYAYMADITAPEHRSKAFGLVGAAWAAGFVAGPALGGILATWGPRVPFWAAAALSGAAFLYGLAILPESLAPDKRMPFAWSRANPLGALRLLRSHAELIGLSFVNFLLYFAHHIFSVIYVLYAAHRYGLGPLEVGLLLGCAGLLDMAMQGYVVGRVSARLGDRRTMVIGLVAGAIGIFLMGIAPDKYWFAATLLPNSLWALAIPTLQSLMTARVSEREQGQLQGANNSVAAIAGIASPLFFGWLYGQSIDTLPGLSFVVGSLILLAAAFIGHRSGRA
ncbi:TCR/Tet family MFS transporter [Sphingobium sufflavum]|uniref:TCR/Tet family MFS transporter n=1 Tax=Sphingobium sufflavum TaxID=1129547 RepID=UPI001F2598C1|nr:TCR/Tet family MFS transporter [Sphingobium sufflavum]MCE7798668.1 TCR/Tet family MFS transporter [Sphingobium sufflavum]